MDNAVKAFYIAAGVLISIMIASIMAYLFTTGARLGENHEQTQADRALELFNSKFSAYIKDDNTISDVISVINMAYDNNLKNENDAVNSVEVVIKLKNSKVLKLIPDDGLEKNQIYYYSPSTSKRGKVYLYDLLNKNIRDLKTTDTKISLGLDLEQKFNDTYHYGGYRYHFKADSRKVTYSEVTGKINYMYFELY